MEFNFRPILRDELGLLQKIGRETYEPYYPHIWHPGGIDWYMELCFGTENLEADFQNPNLEYWVAEDSSAQVVGFLKLILQKAVPNTPISEALYLEKIYLMPAYFGKGAGQTLIQFAEKRANALELATIWLMVLKNGPVKAYERAGFEIIDEVFWDFDLLKMEERGGWVMLKHLT